MIPRGRAPLKAPAGNVLSSRSRVKQGDDQLTFEVVGGARSWACSYASQTKLFACQSLAATA